MAQNFERLYMKDAIENTVNIVKPDTFLNSKTMTETDIRQA